jgi:hypothetical protein
METRILANSVRVRTIHICLYTILGVHTSYKLRTSSTNDLCPYRTGRRTRVVLCSEHSIATLRFCCIHRRSIDSHRKRDTVLYKNWTLVYCICIMTQQGEVIELLDSDSEPEGPAGTIDLCESSDDNDKVVQPPQKAVSLHQKRKRKVSLSQSSSVKGSSRRDSLLNESSSSDDGDDLLLGGPVFSNRKPSPTARTSQYPLAAALESPARTMYLELILMMLLLRLVL